MSQNPSPRPFVSVVAASLLGGATYGLVDALRATLADSLPFDPTRALTLALINAAALGLAALVPGLVLGLAQRLRVLSPLRAWPGVAFLVGLFSVGLVDFGEAWFKAVPPFTEPPPLHGNPLVVAGLVLLALVLLIPPARALNGRPGAVLAGFFVVLLLGRAASDARQLPRGGEPQTGARNVLLITMDTARADYFSAYGRTDLKTPHFDALAREGVLFTNAFSQIPVTGPSHTSMMAGVAPWEHGNLLNGLPLDPKLPLLAERLRDQGWRTGAFVSAYVLDGSLGFSRGFQVYDDDFGWLQGVDGTLLGRLQAMAQRFTQPDLVLERIGGRTTDQALAWLQQNGTGPAPFFAWVHLFDPHGPYTPPPPWDTAYYQGDPRDPSHTSMAQAQNLAAYLKPSLAGITDADYVLAQYAGEVGYTDAQIGRLMDWLKQSGQLENTLVIAVADHGESLAGEHGVWFNHGDDLYEPSTWIPWAIRLPEGKHGGAVVDELIELTDLAPTVYEVLGLQGPETMTGQSALPAIAGQPHRPFARGVAFDRPINTELRRKGELKNPTWRLAALRFPTTRFVDHEHDSLSSENWAVTEAAGLRTEQRAPIAIPVENQLTELTEGLFASGSVERSQAEQSEEAIKKLQALGYMEE